MTRLLREARGWTQEHLAEASGLSVRTIQRIEAGEPPAQETLLALAATFDLSVVDLEDGPHILIDHKELIWPGLSVRVFKDGYQMGGCLSVDSRRRTACQIGFPALVLDIPHDEYEDRVQMLSNFGPEEEVVPIGFGKRLGFRGLRFLVDGEVFNPYEHLRTVHYDAVLVHGHFKAIKHYRDEFPKHFVPVPHYEGPDPFPNERPFGSGDPDYPWLLELPATEPAGEAMLDHGQNTD